MFNAIALQALQFGSIADGAYGFRSVCMLVSIHYYFMDYFFRFAKKNLFTYSVNSIQFIEDMKCGLGLSLVLNTE